MEIAKAMLIQIQWEGPFKYKELASLNNNETDYGIYQIYGDHFVYGDNVLLYIGQASQQTFGTRIMQHTYWLEDDYTFYVGRISGSNTPPDDIWHDEISLSESLLINIHTPAYNSVHINGINNTKLEHIHILNLGIYKKLLPELSGIRWISKQHEVWPDVYRWGK